PSTRCSILSVQWSPLAVVSVGISSSPSSYSPVSDVRCNNCSNHEKRQPVKGILPMHLSNPLKTIAALLIGGALLVGCAAPPAPAASGPAASEAAAPAEATAGGTLLTVETGGTYSLDPYVTPRFTTIMASLYDGLVTTDLEKNYVGHLAESYTISEDGLSITFILREGVTFHDGTVFDATAAKWNLDRYFAPET